MAIITDANGFRPMRKLHQAARDPRVREIEGGGMDDGRVFIHLKPGFIFDIYDTTSKSVGCAADVSWAMSLIKAKD